MALMVGDKQSNNLRHFCKICKKGFGCGRALGGHMRAHGLRDDGGGMDNDDDAASDWDGGGEVNVPPSSKKMYALRTNPNRLKNRVCENCGKELLSWKSFLEHGIGKCVYDDADESFVSSDGNDMSGGGGGGRRGCGNSSKRKRSSGTNKAGSFNNNNNPNCSSSNEEEDLGAANCLMMLSNATVEADESSALVMSKDEERRRDPNFSFMVPKSQHVPSDHHHNKAKEVGNNNHNNNKGLFECKACKKVFNSHQALGGHRASHKKVKGCFAARLDNLDDTGADDDVITHEDQLFPTNNKSNTFHFDHHGSNKNNNNTSSSSNRKSKVHECSICHRVFSSGQALGGHKRCHWITSNAPDTTALARFQQFQEQIEQHMKSNEVVVPNKFDVVDSDPIDLKLDLNLPAPSPDSGHRRNASTEIYLPSWVGGRIVKELHKDDNTSQSHQMDNDNNGEECKNNSNKNLNISNGSTIQNVVVVEDDEADSKVKLAKLSELKDMTEEGSSSAWLQVGIGSSTTTDDVGTDP